MEALLRRDDQAWEQFLQQYRRLIFAAIHGALASCNFKAADQDLEDLFWTVVGSLLEDDCRRLRAFEGRKGCTLATWLRLIAGRKAIDFVRSRIRIPPPGDGLDTLADPSPLPSEAAATRDAERVLAEAVERLPARERLVVSLCADGKKPEEIARILKTTVGNMYVIKHRAYQSLQAAVASRL